MSVQHNAEDGTLAVPDLGITLRTLLAAAAKGYSTRPRRNWRVLYKGAIIGTIRIKVPRKRSDGQNVNTNGASNG